MLGDDRPRLEDEPAGATLEHIDLATGKTQELAERVDRVEVSGDGIAAVHVVDKGELRVMPAGRKAEKDDPEIVEASTWIGCASRSTRAPSGDRCSTRPGG